MKQFIAQSITDAKERILISQLGDNLASFEKSLEGKKPSKDALYCSQFNVNRFNIVLSLEMTKNNNTLYISIDNEEFTELSSKNIHHLFISAFNILVGEVM